jgi:protoporphyrinogen oxidase
MKVGIIGAGPAGMTAAYELSKSNVDVEIFESGSCAGGMARSISLWGQKVDLGPHRFFSDDTRVNRIWLEVAGSDYDMVDRLTRILYKGKFFYYPLKPFNALANLGVFEAVRCLSSYAKELIVPHQLGPAPSFEEWVVSRFGRRLFTIFFKTYSEKLWGITCSELDADFAAQRIKKFSLLEALKSAFGIGMAKHKTLVDQFAYPHGSTGSIYERMSEKCKANGGIVHLSSPVQRVVVKDKAAVAIELADGSVKAFDHVISCMPITDLVRRMDLVDSDVTGAVGKLKFRNTIIVFLRVEGADLFKDNWLYVHSTDLETGRITNFRNWTPHIYGTSCETILALEYWCYESDDFWSRSDAELIGQASEEVKRSGLLGRHQVLDGHVERIGKSYPVYSRGYKEPLKVVTDYLRTIKNLSVIGRYGSFKYNNQDHSMLMGYLAAQNIAVGAANDLWEINTDYEYQESSVITKTGLVVKK